MLFAFRKQIGLLFGAPQVLLGLLLIGSGYGRPAVLHQLLQRHLGWLVDDPDGFVLGSSRWALWMAAAAIVLPLTGAILGFLIGLTLERVMPRSGAAARVRTLRLPRRFFVWSFGELLGTLLAIAVGILAGVVMGYLVIPLLGLLFYDHWLLYIGDDTERVARAWFGVVTAWVVGLQFIAGGLSWFTPDPQELRTAKQKSRGKNLAEALEQQSFVGAILARASYDLGIATLIAVLATPGLCLLLYRY